MSTLSAGLSPGRVVALTQPRRLPAGRAGLLLREVVVVATGLAVYNAGRLLAAHRAGGAYDSARRLWGLERELHLPSEQGLQNLALGVPDLVRAANGYYAVVHFPLTMAVLVWLFLRRPGTYLWARRALVRATAAGLLLQLLMPTAPPRMLSSLGFIDTGAAYGQSVYGPVSKDELANQFAALPSLHVGWALLVAVVLVRTCQTRWRWLWVAHPVLTVLVVVVTGNHYWLDGVVGAALVVAALALTGRFGGDVVNAAARHTRAAPTSGQSAWASAVPADPGPGRQDVRRRVCGGASVRKPCRAAGGPSVPARDRDVADAGSARGPTLI